MIRTLADAISAYKTLAAADGKSPRTIEWVETTARRFGTFLGHDADLEAISRQDMRRFIVALRERKAWAGHPFTPAAERNVSASSINNYVRGVRLLFSSLEREGLIEPHDLTGMKAPKAPQKAILPLTEAQLKALFKALRARPHGLRNRALVGLLWDPGLRVSEATTLREEDVDLDGRQIKVFGKGAKERILPLSSWTAKSLLIYRLKGRPEPIGTDAFFLTGDGGPLNRRAVGQMLRRAGRRAGVSKCHPHRLRHTFAILYLRNQGDPFTLQRLLGHSDLTMTRRYVALADGDVREAHRRASPADRLRL